MRMMFACLGDDKLKNLILFTHKDLLAYLKDSFVLNKSSNCNCNNI